MAAGTNPIFEAAPVLGSPQQFVNADGTTKKTICTAGTNGTRIDMIKLCSNDTAAVNLNFYITSGGTDYYIGYVNIPIGSGYPSVVAVDAMTSLSPVLGYLTLPPSALLKCAANAAVTAAKVVDVVPMGGDY